MTLTQLEYFLALAEHRSFSRAARACGITQPTLSAQFQKLEEELGHTLLDRKAQPMILTPLGAVLLDQAEHTVGSAKAIRAMVDQFEHPLVGALRLGVIAPLGSVLGAFWLGILKQACPHLTLVLEEATAPTLQQKLGKEELDAAIIQVEGWNGPGKLLPMFHEAWWALGPVLGGQPPPLSQSEAWLMGPNEDAARSYAQLKGWKPPLETAIDWPSLFGRVLLAERSKQWVFLSESELALLSAEAQKRAQPWGGMRSLAWVSSLHGAEGDVPSRVRQAMKDRPPASMRALQ